jgi:6-phosphogluconolactonase
MKTFALLISIFTLGAMQAQKDKFNLIVGTYTNSCESKGIYVYEFDTNSGDFSFKSASEQLANPSYLSLSSANDIVYAVSENDQKQSGVIALKYNQEDGKLIILNKSDGKASGSCYIINDDKNVLTANYGSGSISVFGKNTDGSLTEVKQVVQHTGKGINLKRQDKPHVHMVYFSPDKKYVLANDLGTDIVSVYKYNSDSEKEILKFNSSVSVSPGGGPRHLIFSKDGKYVYVLQELVGSLITFRYKNGKLEKVSEASILPKEYKGKIQTADLHISPDGKFLYATNRGEMGEITLFKIGKKGKLEFVEQMITLGKGPRNFAIDPTGNFLLVAHQYSNTIIIFKRDKKSGNLTATGKKIELCSPVCMVFGNN